MRRTIISLIILSVFVSLFWVAKKYNINKDIVENYCSVRYEHDVNSYKECRNKTNNQILIELTQKIQEDNSLDISKLPIVSF